MMARWRYWDDPDVRMGDVIMLDRAYRPSWFRKRRMELASWLRMRWPLAAKLVAGRGHKPLR